MTTTNNNNQSSNNCSIAVKLLNLIGDTPINPHNTKLLTTDYNEVATILDVESKSTAHYKIGIVYYTGGISKTIQRTHINQLILYGLILDHYYDTETQKHTFFHDTLYEMGDYEQSSLMYMDKSNDDHSYNISTVHNTVATQPEKDDEISMITLSKFYTSVRNKLDLRRYSKTKVKSTGLHLLSNNLTEHGNFRKWYYGVSHDPKGNDTITLIPYLCGDEVSLEGGSSEIADITYNDRQKQTLSTIGQKWNIDELIQAREPIPIHKVEDRFAFLNPMPNVVNLPIKMAGNDKVYLPSEYEGMVEALSKIIAYEKANNPSYADNYAYLTVDKTFVKEGSSQSRFVYDKTDTTVQRNYYVTNIVPNEFVVSTRQAQHVEVMRSIPLTIYYYDSYQVHSPTQAMATTDKTTLCVSFTKRQLNTIGNGLNPLIPYEWTYQPLEAEVTE